MGSESREYRRSLYRSLIERGLCTRCCTRPVCKQNKALCSECRSRQHEARSRRIQDLRDQIYEAYGNRCGCCGEVHPVFLTIDHIDGGGNQERKNIHTYGFYRRLVRDGFPDAYQLLCWNCNAGRHRNGGSCPHEEER